MHSEHPHNAQTRTDCTPPHENVTAQTVAASVVAGAGACATSEVVDSADIESFEKSHSLILSMFRDGDLAGHSQYDLDAALIDCMHVLEFLCSHRAALDAFRVWLPSLDSQP